MHYSAPWWLPGGHAQTIWAARRSRCQTAEPVLWSRQRLTTPDDDFVDVDWLTPTPQGGSHATGPAFSSDAPLLVLFHGLEGSSQSPYAQAFATVARDRGWRFAVPHFRGCSGQINRAPRAYHSGDHEEIDWMLRQLRLGHAGPVLAVGISLGGNALMRWAGLSGQTADTCVKALASVCAPLDLSASGQAIGRGLNRHLYTPMFLRTMIPKAMAKLAQYPGLFDRERLLRVRDLYGFDDVFTAPLHGFAGTEDYWRRASALPVLKQVAVPALALNARNDPFIPALSLPGVHSVSDHLTLWQPEQGGHVGFPVADTRWPDSHVLAMPHAVADFLQAWL